MTPEGAPKQRFESHEEVADMAKEAKELGSKSPFDDPDKLRAQLNTQEDAEAVSEAQVDNTKGRMKKLFGFAKKALNTLPQVAVARKFTEYTKKEYEKGITAAEAEKNLIAECFNPDVIDRDKEA